ncbi:zinc metalloproteinase nas-15-like isoform X2 [Rhopilema esculentum]|eukprot:gene7168-12833_t
MAMISYITLALSCLSLIQGKALFEGDIVLTDKTKQVVEGEANTFDAVASAARKWPGGVVPFVFDRYFDNYRRQVVQQAIDEFNKHTCVKFVPRTNERNYVRFMVGQGCSSMIGMTGGYQDISIGNYCYYKGIVMHEMMHAIGFWHEQSRLDRDNYVTIYWQNIQKNPDMSYNFRKYSHGEADYYGEGYDYDSLMHYENNAFSSNGYSTIVARSDPNKKLGQRAGFSATDIRQINKLYSCQLGGNCVDNHSYCSYWASIGECQKNPNYMLTNCKKSCQRC